MKLLLLFFKLIRWPNLVFIALAQYLFYYCIQYKIYTSASVYPMLNNIYLSLLCFSSICIAAAGYIINDYFDVNIDIINKPHKLIIGKFIKPRWAMVWHWILSVTGIAIGFYIDYKTPTSLIGLSNIICVLLLFGYSVSLKRKLLSGNIVISLLTAWTILVIPFAEWNALFNNTQLRQIYIDVDFKKLYRIGFLYTGFSFIISLIREAIKDMEDMEGDRQYGCKTMPIVWGLRTTKVFTAVWIIVLIGVLAIVQLYTAQLGWWASVSYCILLIMLPLGIALKKLLTAQTAKTFHALSSLIKLIMLAGIVSMIFF